MSKHKWHKEIKAWADGAEIESRFYDKQAAGWTEWNEMESLIKFSEDDWWEYRIKPQPKEPQYLYVYFNGDYSQESGLQLSEYYPADEINKKYYRGKIKLEQDDE